MEMGTNFGSGLDFATFLNTAMNRDDGMFGNNNGLLWIFLLLLFGGWSGNGWNRNSNPATDVAVGEAVQKAVAEARADGLSDQVIVDAVKGNGAAINQLATTLIVILIALKILYALLTSLFYKLVISLA